MGEKEEEIDMGEKHEECGRDGEGCGGINGEVYKGEG